MHKINKYVVLATLCITLYFALRLPVLYVQTIYNLCLQAENKNIIYLMDLNGDSKKEIIITDGLSKIPTAVVYEIIPSGRGTIKEVLILNPARLETHINDCGIEVGMNLYFRREAAEIGENYYANISIIDSNYKIQELYDGNLEEEEYYKLLQRYNSLNFDYLVVESDPKFVKIIKYVMYNIKD